MLVRISDRRLARPWAPPLLWCAGFLVVCLMALYRIHLNGDGGEYLMTTHAFYQRASPRILSADVVDFLRLPDHARASLAYPTEIYRQLVENFHAAHPVPWAGYASTEPDKLYAIHFWLYSLLALPFYVCVTLLGLNPLMAFGALNLSCVALVCHYLRRILADHLAGALVLFLSMGTTFYLDWTGPEVMSACCALIASIALQRGETARAMFFSGLGATQNPSLVFLMAFAVGARLVYWRWPLLAWPGVRLRALTWGERALALLGIGLAALPYLWFQMAFGMPSLVGHYFAAPSLVTWNRFLSLLIDADQGMLLGLPGLFAGLLATPLLLGRAQRRRWVLAGAAMGGAFVVTALPTLATLNWNSGCVVLLRYGYWLAMPLLSLLLLASQLLTRARTRAMLAIALALQMLVVAEFGIRGQLANPVGHSRPARWLLAHFPSHYNPDAEIFYERSTGAEREAPLAHTLSYLYYHDGQPVKLLRHASNTGVTRDACPPGLRLVGSDVKTVDAGWQYAHAPFHCRLPPHADRLQQWTFDTAHPADRIVLGAGWSGAESAGTWTDVSHSYLRVAPPDKRADAGFPGTLGLRVAGHYFGDQITTEVRVNGRSIGQIALNGAFIALPYDPRAAPRALRPWDIEFIHPRAASPKAQGLSDDARTLAFLLQTLTLEVQIP